MTHNNPLQPWRVNKSEYVLSDRWLKVRADECYTEEGVKIAPYYVLEYPDWVFMVVINEAKEVLITQQYRHGAGRILYELPAGTVEKEDKSPLETAKRELLEETGYQGDFNYIGPVFPNAATYNNNLHVFLVKNPIKKKEPDDDPTEKLNFHFVPINDVWKMIESGEFNQALHICSLVLGLRHLKYDYD